MARLTVGNPRDPPVPGPGLGPALGTCSALPRPRFSRNMRDSTHLPHARAGTVEPTVPVELTERSLRDAVAVLGEWDADGARAAESALGWLGWEGEGPLLLRRYDVQLFVWYQLPRKFLAPLDDKRETADALARLLERLGGRAATYAEVCRSPETDRLLYAWEAEDPDAWRLFRGLLDGSGIEPPDTGLLVWGQVMGLEEACVREEVALALEHATEEGSLSPGARGFRRRQAEAVKAALRQPRNGEAGQTRIEAVHAERMEDWLERGHSRGNSARRAIVKRVASVVAADPPVIEPDLATAALSPALWLLEQAMDGVTLTQTGALNRALVREVAERWPGWWNAPLFGPPHREDDLTFLCELHQLLRQLRLVRRDKRRIVITARGRELHDDPAELLVTLAVELLRGESFPSACAELASALILDGMVADYSRTIARAIHPAIVAEGWQCDGDSPSERDVAWGVAGFLRPAESLGLLTPGEGASRYSRDQLMLTPAGRVALTAGLRARAFAAAAGPY